MYIVRTTCGFCKCRTPTAKKDFRQLKLREKMYILLELKELEKVSSLTCQILVLYQVTSSLLWAHSSYCHNRKIHDIAWSQIGILRFQHIKFEFMVKIAKLPPSRIWAQVAKNYDHLQTLRFSLSKTFWMEENKEVGWSFDKWQTENLPYHLAAMFLQGKDLQFVVVTKTIPRNP